MIQPTDNPIRMVRELKGAPLSIIIALGLVHQCTSQEWLERTTGYTDKPVSQALQYLREAGLVDETPSGWQLAKAKANQVPLTLMSDEGGIDPSLSEDTASISNQTENIQKNRNNSDSDNLSKLEEVNNNNFISNSSNLTNLSSENGKNTLDGEKLDEIRQVLESAGELFGHEIIGEVGDYSDIDRLLGWIAQAFSAHTKVKSPAGLVYWAFHQGKDRSPEKKYLKHPEQYLPEVFLRASGQYIFNDEGEENGT
jgi:hypothetical protein